MNKEHKKFLTIFAIMSLAAGCCLMVLFYPLLNGKDLFDQEPDAEDTANAFFSALSEDDYPTAFDLCDDYLQKEFINPENMQSEIETDQLQPESWKIESQDISQNEVDFSGSMDFRIRISGTFRITMHYHENGWRVTRLFLDY